MSDKRDPLEDELAGFLPQPVSASLPERIGRDLANLRCRSRIRITLGLAAAAVAAASILWFMAGTPPSADRPRPDMVTAPASAAETDPPTLAVYRRVLNQSPEALEQLLDRQAAAICRSEKAALIVSRTSDEDALWGR